MLSSVAFFVFLLGILTGAESSIVCGSNEVYCCLVKTSKDWASEESFRISSGSTILYTSPTLHNTEVRILEVCLPSTQNNQYSLVMMDGRSDGWTNGSYLEVFDAYNVLVIKAAMEEGSSETVTFSMYTPIARNAEWNYSTYPSDLWYASDFVDAGWSAVSLGTSMPESSITQFVRKPFSSYNSVTAVELGLYFQYGIIVYLNGEEVFRDNVPGYVDESTPAISYYTTLTWHKLYRSMVANSNNVLAVEIHLYNRVQGSFNFNAYLTFVGGFSSIANCYVTPMLVSDFPFSDYSTVSWIRSTSPLGSAIATPTIGSPIYDPFILGDNCYYDVQETCFDNIIPDIEVVKQYLAERDAYPTKALKHTRVLALSGMTLPAIALFRESLSKQVKNPNPVDMYFYSDYKIVRYVGATMAVPLISLSEFTRPSRIVFGDGSFKREGMAAVIQWMVDNRNKGYFVNLEYFQISGHKAASFEGSEEDAHALQSQIVANLHTMCTDKTNFPKLNTLNFNSNAYNEFNNGFDAALRSACDKVATGVTIRAMQVTVTYPPMCSTTNSDNYWYYDMEDEKEVAQCRFTWNWEMGDTVNVYAPAGPFPNDNTYPCDDSSSSFYITVFRYPSPSYQVCQSVYFSVTPTVNGVRRSFSILSQTLPSGLVLNGSTGLISGTPSRIEESRTVTVKVQNQYSSMATTITFSVASSPTGNYYNSNRTQVVLVNQPIAPIAPELPCPECTYSALSSLPRGITLNATSGLISGVPTQAFNTQQIQIRRSNRCGVGTDTIQLTVRGLPSVSYSSEYLLALGEYASIQPVATSVSSFTLLSGSLPSGLSLNSVTGVISGSPLVTVNTCMVVIRASNEFASANATFVFRVIQRITLFDYSTPNQVIALNSSVSLSPQFTGSHATFTVVSGSLPLGLSLNATSGVISGSPFQSVTNRQVTIRAQNELGLLSSTVSFTVLLPISSFQYPQSSYILPRSVFFSVRPSAVGDSIVYSVSFNSLPSGLHLDSTTGVISGTPSQSVTNLQVTIRVQNALGFKTTVLAFTILLPISFFSYPSSNYVLERGVSITVTPSIMGDSVVCSTRNGTLPVSLSLNAHTGVISGAPSISVISPIAVTVMASNALGSKTFTLTLSVLVKPTTLSYPKTDYVLGVGDSVTIVPVGSGDAVLYSLYRSSLPEGLQLNPDTGVIWGIPTAPTKQQSITVLMGNEVGSVRCSIVVRVISKMSDFRYPKTKYGLVNGKSYTLVPSFSGDEPSFSIQSGSLPEGVNLNSSSGVIEGMPIDFYSKSIVTVQAENSVSASRVTLVITVLPCSLSILILLPFILVLILILLCILFQLSCKRNKLPVRSLERVKASLPEPVKAGRVVAGVHGDGVVGVYGDGLVSIQALDGSDVHMGSGSVTPRQVGGFMGDGSMAIHQVNGPVSVQAMDVPMNVREVDVPVHPQVMDVPVHPQVMDLPINTHTMDPPMNTHTMDPQMNTHTMDPPINTHTIDPPLHPHTPINRSIAVQKTTLQPITPTSTPQPVTVTDVPISPRLPTDSSI